MSNIITEQNKNNVIEILDRIIENFNFERVRKTMLALDWKWFGFKQVPSIDEIKEFAANLMWECANKDIDCVSTGGFRVEKDFNDPNDPWMRLVFEVTDFYASKF